MEIKKDNKNIIINFNKKEPTKRELFQQKVKDFKFDLGVGYTIFGIMLTLLLAVTLFRLLSGNDILSIRTLLLDLKAFEPINGSWLTTVDLTIYESWGILDGIRTFFNVIISIFEFLLWIVGAMWEVFKFLAYILAYIVGIV